MQHLLKKISQLWRTSAPGLRDHILIIFGSKMQSLWK